MNKRAQGPTSQADRTASAAALPLGRRAQQELATAIAGTRNQADLIRLRALQVQMLARMRKPGEALALLGELDAQVARKPTPANRAWLLYARANQKYFAGRMRESIDTFDSCANLARELDSIELHALATVGPAFAYLQLDELRSAFARCMQVHALGQAAGPAAQYQMHLALGSMRQAGGDLPGALDHFKQATHYAHAAGDLLAVMGLRTRAAGLNAWMVRKQAARGSPDPTAADRALATLSGAIGEALREETHAAIPELQLLVGAMQMLLQRHEEALATYQAHLPVAANHGLDDDVLLARSDSARCLFALGRRKEAVATARAAVGASATVSEHEVRAIAFGNLAYLLWNTRARAEAETFAAQAATEWAAAEAKQTVALSTALG